MLSGKALAGVLAVIFVLAFVVPPSAATWLQRRRIARAWTDVDVIADRLSTCATDQRSQSETADRAFVTGPGNVPDVPSGDRWMQNVPIVDEVCGLRLRPDPWANRYLIGPSWVVSAGPNGILETPFPTPDVAALSADDIGKRH